MNSHYYRYGRSVKPHHHKFLIVLAISLVIIAIVAGLVIFDMRRTKSEVVKGAEKTVSQVLGNTTDKLIVDEKLFSMELPGHWKQHAKVNDSRENSITWIATKKGEDSRSLTLYIDKVPPNRTAINRLLPVKAEGNRLVYGEISENCASFTGGGTFNTGQAVSKPETPAKWQGIDFICNLPRVVDNETGTGSADGLNAVFVTGPTGGKHRYFFVYQDRNIQPKSGVLLDAIDSFRAK